MSARPLDHYCGKCRTALNRWVVDGESTFIHAPVNFDSWSDGHDPEPIPLAEFNMADLVIRCDVDSVPPTWSYTFDFSLLKPNWLEIVNPWGPDWSLCGECAGVVERRDVYALTERAYAPMKGILPRGTVIGAILPVYKILLRQPFTRTIIN